MGAMVGIDPDSDGLARAERMGVPTTADGVDGLLAMPGFGDIKLVFDATSAGGHLANWVKLADTGVRVLDLTPVAIGPYCVPVVNLDEHLEAPNLSMVTCGGHATVPIVAAVGENGTVSYAETMSAISSKSVGPGTCAKPGRIVTVTKCALLAGCR
jgi:acetaldehyde dehydrogenase